jgi:hypothetical protein
MNSTSSGSSVLGATFGTEYPTNDSLYYAAGPDADAWHYEITKTFFEEKMVQSARILQQRERMFRHHYEALNMHVDSYMQKRRAGEPPEEAERRVVIARGLTFIADQHLRATQREIEMLRYMLATMPKPNAGRVYSVI